MKLLWKHYKPSNSDLNVIECGIEQFYLNLTYDYKVRQEFVIHYIEEGEGFFMLDNKKVELKAGDGFILRKGMVPKYGTRKENPWKYYWVGVSGEKALEYLMRSSVLNSFGFTYPDSSQSPAIIKDICEISMNETEYLSSDLKKLAKLYDLTYDLIASFPSDHSEKNLQLAFPLQDAILFMNEHYNEKIAITEISAHANISRSYLYKLFMRYTFQTPQSYLINLRLFKASILLKNTPQTVKEIALQVGYSDPFVFSHAFKKNYGVSPSEYRMHP